MPALREFFCLNLCDQSIEFDVADDIDGIYFIDDIDGGDNINVTDYNGTDGKNEGDKDKKDKDKGDKDKEDKRIRKTRIRAIRIRKMPQTWLVFVVGR